MKILCNVSCKAHGMVAHNAQTHPKKMKHNLKVRKIVEGT